jgi:TatD DNase family protein
LYQFFDSHVHLADPYYEKYGNHIISSLQMMNIKVCCVSVNIETAQAGLLRFRDYPDIVKQFIGIHPQFAISEDISKFSEILDSNISRIAGIGEIGLDPTYVAGDNNAWTRQNNVFSTMLQFAEKTGKPVSIHSRKALDDVMQTLPSYTLNGILLHWFAGNKKQLNKAMDMGLYVSYGPTLVYSDDKKSLLRNTDRSRVLFETDGPVRYSRCFDNMPSSPTSFLASIVASASSMLGISFDEMSETSYRNAETFLKGTT